MNHPRAKALLELLPQSVSVDDLDAFNRVAAAAVTFVPDVVFEQEEDLPLIPVPHLLPAYLRLPDVAAGERILRAARRALTDTHGKVSAALLAHRARLDGSAFIPLPPIALEVLDKADNLEQVGEELLECRRRYGQMRKYFLELEETLISKAASLREKGTAESKLNEAIRRSLSVEGMSDVTALGSFAQGVLESIEFEFKVSEHGEQAVAVSLTKILKKMTDIVQSQYWRYRLRPLYSTANRYLDTNAAQISRIIHKHFHYTIGKSDLSLCRSYGSQVDKLLRAMSPGVIET